MRAGWAPRTPVGPPAAHPRVPILAPVLLFVTFLTTLLTGIGYADVGSEAFEALASGRLDQVAAAALTLFAAGLPYAIGLMAFFVAHELGHYAACRYYRIPCTLPYFIPGPPCFLFGTFGAVIRIKGPIPDRRKLFDIGVAGPIAGFPVAVALVAWGLLRAQPAPAVPPEGALVFGDSLLTWILADRLFADPAGELQVDGVYVAGWLGLLATAMNLIPAGQFDGGHIVYGLAPRWHALVSKMSAVFLLALVATRLLTHGELSAWTVWAFVVLVLGRRHPPVPLGHRRLGAARVALAVLAGAILLICFMPTPLSIVTS